MIRAHSPGWFFLFYQVQYLAKEFLWNFILPFCLGKGKVHHRSHLCCWSLAQIQVKSRNLSSFLNKKNLFRFSTAPDAQIAHISSFSKDSFFQGSLGKHQQQSSHYRNQQREWRDEQGKFKLINQFVEKYLE
jgi:hypothetical protein